MDLYFMADGETANVAKGATAADQPRDEVLRWFDEIARSVAALPDVRGREPGGCG